MKKVIAFCCACFIFVSMTLTKVYAQDPNIMENINGQEEIPQTVDEFSYNYISEVDAALLQKTDSDNYFLKIYNTPFIFAFGEYNSIEEILRSEHIKATLYLEMNRSFGIVSIQSISDDKKTLQKQEGKGDLKTEGIGDLCSNRINSKFPANTEIYAVYYLYGETNRHGTAIYYRTSLGDYVYYKDFRVAGTKYLFPAKDFFEIMKAIYAQMGPDTPIGGWDISAVRDLSKYDMNSPAFKLKTADDGMTDRLVSVGLIAAAVIAAGILAVYVAHKVARRKSSEL